MAATSRKSRCRYTTRRGRCRIPAARGHALCAAHAKQAERDLQCNSAEVAEILGEMQEFTSVDEVNYALGQLFSRRAQADPYARRRDPQLHVPVAAANAEAGAAPFLLATADGKLPQRRGRTPAPATGASKTRRGKAESRATGPSAVHAANCTIVRLSAHTNSHTATTGGHKSRSDASRAHPNATAAHSAHFPASGLCLAALVQSAARGCRTICTTAARATSTNASAANSASAAARTGGPSRHSQEHRGIPGTAPAGTRQNQ